MYYVYRHNVVSSICLYSICLHVVNEYIVLVRSVVYIYVKEKCESQREQCEHSVEST